MNLLVMGVVMAAMMLLIHGRNHQARTPPLEQQEGQGARAEGPQRGCGQGNASHLGEEHAPHHTGEGEGMGALSTASGE